MRWSLNTGTRSTVDADLEPRLLFFFQRLGQKYHWFSNTADLSSQAYAYEMSQLLEKLVENGLTCPTSSSAAEQRRVLFQTPSASPTTFQIYLTKMFLMHPIQRMRSLNVRVKTPYPGMSPCCP